MLEYLGYYALASVAAAIGFAVLIYWREYVEERNDRT